jgi:hypothetical protein
MRYLPAIFALLVAAAGWFYMFYSKAATNLGGVEAQSSNRLRIRLRRVGGLMMIGLAFASYAACVAIDRAVVRDSSGGVVIEHHSAAQAVWYLLAVFVLMAGNLVIALIDLRLTKKLRESRKKDGLS